MFHYFYLISLLLCINLVFSYEYIDDDGPRRTFHNLGKNVKKVGILGRQRDKKNQIRQEYSYDKNPVEFDLAGFIQPDEETVADEESVKRRNQLRRRRISKNNDYNSLLGLNMERETNSRGINEDYVNFGDSQANLNPTLLNLSPPLLKDSMNIKQFKMNNMDDHNANDKHLLKNQIVSPEEIPAHNPQKKCVIENLKLPFLSRFNKSESSKPKKSKKRKLFCFHCPKTTSQENFKPSEVPIVVVTKNKKNKRSYEERLCPACKRKFMMFAPDDESQKASTKEMHNRLISEKYMESDKDPLNKGTNKIMKYSSEDYRQAIEKIQREKREDPGILMRRELDIIQQTIEHDDYQKSSVMKASTNRTQD